jgi:hypothetical protein
VGITVADWRTQDHEGRNLNEDVRLLSSRNGDILQEFTREMIRDFFSSTPEMMYVD